MQNLGFRVDRSMFVKSYGPIDHSVVFQRCQRSRELLFKLFISISDPFEPAQELKRHVCLHAYFDKEGPCFASRMHWDENELVAASSLFERLGPPFLQQFDTTDKLTAIVEAAQVQFENPEAYLRGPLPEPTTAFSKHLAALRNSVPRRLIPANEATLSLLYWHKGDIGRALKHAQHLEMIPNDRRMSCRVRAMTRPVV